MDLKNLNKDNISQDNGKGKDNDNGKSKKKNILTIGLVVFFIIIVGVLAWYFSAKEGEKDNKVEIEQTEIVLVSEGDNLTPEQNIRLQQGLINIVGKHLEAVIMTNSVFFTDIEKTEFSEWEKKVNKSVELWEEVEVLKNEMISLLDELGVPETQASVPASKVLDEQMSSIFPVAHAYSGAPIPELGAVTAVFESSTHRQKLRSVMEVFGWDKEVALGHLKREQGLLKAGAWDKAGDTYQRWETTGMIIKDTSKVTVFIASNIITAGAVTATVGAIQGVSMVVGGVSLAIEIGEDVNIAIGNEESAAVLHQAQEDISILTHIVSIVSLRDIGDPGNIFYLADSAISSIRLPEFAEDDYVYLTRNEDAKIYFSRQKPDDVNVPEDLPEEEAKKVGLVEGNYKIDGQEIEVKKKEPVKSEPEKIQDINDIVDIAATLGEFEAPIKPTIHPDSTKIRTSEVNHLTIKIPDSFKGPFTIEYIDVPSSGAGVVLPSKSDSHTINGEFISSNPGIFVVNIKVIDADGNVYTFKTTIYVEGEVTGELLDSEDDFDEFDYLSFECITPLKFPSTEEDCHINVICPNSKNSCAWAERKFVNIIKNLTANYKDLDPMECGVLSTKTTEACVGKDPDACRRAWIGDREWEDITTDDIAGMKTWEDLTEDEKNVCIPLDPDLCERTKKESQSCAEFLGYPDGVSFKVWDARDDLLICYREVSSKKSTMCSEKISAIHTREREKIVEKIKAFMKDQEEISKITRKIRNQISEIEEQLSKLSRMQEKDIEMIAQLESQVAVLQGDLDKKDEEDDAIEAKISALKDNRDNMSSFANTCFNSCYSSISDKESNAVGELYSKEKELGDYKSLMKVIWEKD
jgi:cell division protein FtsB